MAKRSRSATFRATLSSEAASLTDCASLTAHQPTTMAPVLMPWMGYGTYRLGASAARAATLAALRCGYRCIDTAYIYAGEKCEPEVGKAVVDALADGTLASRDELFVITKHWRKFHGYDASLGCLDRSLSRLGLQHVDLWLMHWSHA